MQSSALLPATHDQDHAYWDGGNYELNMSFDGLREKQWQRLMQCLWDHPLLYGPLEARYIPGSRVTRVPAVPPPPTVTQAQHGQIEIGSIAFGFTLLATRSLFECVSVMIPLGMFAGIKVNGAALRRDNPQLAAIDQTLSAIALAIYDTVPFRLAVIGWERECQIISELCSDPALCAEMVAMGNFFIQDATLRLLNMNGTAHARVRPDLTWAAARL